MRARDARDRMAAANPLDRERAAELPVSAAEDALLDALLDEPLPGGRHFFRGVEEMATTRRGGGRRTGRLALGIAAIASGLLAFLLIFGSDGGRPTGQPSSAYAAEVVRFADAAPRLLLDEPGWRVDGLQAAIESSMQFVRGEGPEAEEFSLDWIPSSVRSLASRVNSISGELDTRPITTVPVLGTTATVIEYHEWPSGEIGVFVLWEEGGYVVGYTGEVPSIEALEARLAALRKVDSEAWLAAMPASVVKPGEFEPTVERMLEGVPVPPGFGADDVVATSVPTDRYQLGAAVAGSVSCTWFARWAQGRRDGEEAEVSAAVAAMANVRDWPVIRQMSQEGAYGQILEHLANGMPRGSVYKDRPLEGDIESALNCAEKGIPIPGAAIAKKRS